MQVNFDTNRSYNQNFGSYKATPSGLKLLGSINMSPNDMNRFKAVIKRFNEKGDFIQGTLDEFNGKLNLSIFCSGRHSESKTVGISNPLFSPIRHLEKWADRADIVEKMCKAEANLEELAKNNDKVITDSALMHLKSRHLQQKEVEQLEELLKQLDDPKKERLVTVSFSENHGDLTALLFSSGRYSESMTEGSTSHLFCSPVRFMKKCVQKASQVEQKLKNGTELSEIAKGN